MASPDRSCFEQGQKQFGCKKGATATMARMVRKQIVIDAEREKTLERLAEELDLSQSEVVRRAIDRFAEQMAEEDKRQAAWERFMKMARNAEAHGITDENGRLKWTREELHERGSR